MGDYDDVPYIVIERRSGGLEPFLWGALLGAGVALLLAPRTGRETQDEIRDGVYRLRAATTGRVGEVRDTVSGAVTRTRNRIYDRIDAVRDGVEVRAQQARDALDAGRRAAQDARSELERRIAEAKESASAAADSVRGTRAAPADVDVVVTEVIVEEGTDRPELG